MIARGALHVHTDISSDGVWTLAEAVAFLRSRDFQFVCITEHSEDVDDSRREQLRRTCAELSTPDFCVIPGIEYSCTSRVHIAGVGCDLALTATDPVEVAKSIRLANGFAVLAHPRRLKWQCSDALLNAINAIEVWNIRYDSRFVPMPASIDFVDRARSLNPKLLSAVGLDLHGQNGFYPAAINVTIDQLDRDSILRALAAGHYQLESPLWNLHAKAKMSSAARIRLRALRGCMEKVRSLRDRFEGKGGDR